MSVIISTSSRYNSTLKEHQMSARTYEDVMDKYVEALDAWFLKHKDKLNRPNARLTKFGIIDVSLKNQKDKLEQDFARTMVYFGRWESDTTFKGQAVSGIELGILWTIDSLLDLWYKFVPETLNGYDDIVTELFDLRRDLITLMEKYTYILLRERKCYTLPISRRVKPPNIYDLEFTDTETEYKGAVLTHIETKNHMEVWSDADKGKLMEALASDLNISWSSSVPWYKSSKDREEKANNLRVCRNILNNPEVKLAIKALNERCAKILNRDRSYAQTATGYVISEEARKQQALYDEMKKRVASLEAEWKEAGGNTVNMNKLLQDAVEANFEYHEYKKQAIKDAEDQVQQCIIEDKTKNTKYFGDGSGISGKAKSISYVGDEGKTMYVVTELPANSELGKGIADEAQHIGGPPNRDLVLDSPPELLLMNLYQEYAFKTANTNLRWNEQVHNAMYNLAEVGEVFNKLKKYFFHPWDEELYQNYDAVRDKIEDELGDVLWGIAVVSRLFNLTLGGIGVRNRRKLVERHGKGSPNANKQKI